MLLDQWEDKGPWVLLLALPLAALNFRKGLLSIALLLLLPIPKNSYAFEWHDLWQTKDQQAQQAYHNNQFEQAAKLFENSDWKAVSHYKAGEFDKTVENLKNNQSALSAYNQGNAFAQSGQFEQAIQSYEKALQITPDDADAKYNKALVEKEREKQKKQDKKDNQSKENSEEKNTDEQSEKSEEQKASEQKPEQSNERKTDQQKADEDKEQQDKNDQKQADQTKPQPTDQKKPEETKEEKSKSVSTQEQPSTEEQQANEQWLKRIPDDPAGLLKRKFKYQYGQRGNQ